MGKHSLRKDRTCRNCRHVVENRYCSNCGQENIETRQSFTHLVAHFAEDFTHYDNAFWKTIKALLFRPGRLTTEFILGKRRTFVPPVKLYIFISFITFFILSLVSTPNDTRDDVIKFDGPDAEKDQFIPDYNSLKQFDSLQRAMPESKRFHGAKAYLVRKLVSLDEKYTEEQFTSAVLDSVSNNLPKVLFLYLPFSALSLWVFHNKKRWFYFDHGIFTLHYFSFVLLTLSAFLILQRAFLPVPTISDYIPLIMMFIMMWWFFYFFRSHRRFYGESKLVSRTKSRHYLSSICSLYLFS